MMTERQTELMIRFTDSFRDCIDGRSSCQVFHEHSDTTRPLDIEIKGSLKVFTDTLESFIDKMNQSQSDK